MYADFSDFLPYFFGSNPPSYSYLCMEYLPRYLLWMLDSMPKRCGVVIRGGALLFHVLLLSSRFRPLIEKHI